MKKRIFDNLYLCKGENAINGNVLGCCGDIKTLKGWLEMLFPKSKVDFESYFEGYSANEITEYILKNKGLRLEKFGE